MNDYRFCGTCGAELLQQVRNIGFNRFTGEALVVNSRVCPALADKSKYVFYPRHDHWYLDEDINEWKLYE